MDSYDFFIVTALKLESAANEELQLKGSLITIDGVNWSHYLISTNVVSGGIELKVSDPRAGYLLNHYLKIPTRILLRINEFKAKDFPKLYHKIKLIPWSRYLLGLVPSIEVSCQKSKLMHTERIKETIGKAIDEYLKANPTKKKWLDLGASLSEQTTIFVRFNQDIAMISLDTTGAHLHFRGYLSHKTLAPLRENFAAYLFFLLYQKILSSGLQKFQLIDPMCGSGTLLFEAFHFFKINTSRNFQYQNIACFSEKVHQLIPTQNPIEQLISHYWGHDLDEKAVEASKKNLKTIAQDNDQFHFSQKNFFSSDVFENQDLNPKIVMINIPYQVRIKTKEPMGVARILNQLEIFYKPQFSLILCHFDQWQELKYQKIKLPTHSVYHFNNNSIPVCAILITHQDQK